jgi:hypothetical protein
MKMHSYLRDWGIKSRQNKAFLYGLCLDLSIADTPTLIEGLETVKQVIGYCYAMHQSRKRRSIAQAHSARVEIHKSDVFWRVFNFNSRHNLLADLWLRVGSECMRSIPYSPENHTYTKASLIESVWISPFHAFGDAQNGFDGSFEKVSRELGGLSDGSVCPVMSSDRVLMIINMSRPFPPRDSQLPSFHSTSHSHFRQ